MDTKELTIIGQLSKEQFYRWRFFIEQLRHGKTQVDLINKTHALMEAQLEVSALRARLHKNVVKEKLDSYEVAKNQYEAERANLEKELGYELKDVVIDEVTFEVKKET